MDLASVESAWQMAPIASGQFAWKDDSTLEFLPDGGWQRAMRYEIAIGTDAIAANGLALEETHEFHVQVIGYLEVATVIPAEDAAGVQADATITVSFNRPVVPLVSTEQLDELPDPLTIDPAVAARMIISMAVGLLIQGLLPAGSDWEWTTEESIKIILRGIVKR